MHKPEEELLARARVSRAPSAVLGLKWRDYKWGRWHQEDHMTLGEGRAPLWALGMLVTRRP